MMGTLLLPQEAQLAEKVRLFPCLYDKLEKGYKESDAVADAWDNIADMLDFIEDGSKARNCYGILKKRYLRKRKELKDARKLGTAAAIEKAERSLVPYQFLSWLDSFIQEREGRKNLLKCHKNEDNFDTISLDTQEKGFNHNNMEDIGEYSNLHKDKHPAKKRPHIIAPNKKMYINYIETPSQKSMKENKGEKRKMASEGDDDADEMFCKLLVMELKGLPPIERCMAKNDIRNIVFNYQMASLRQEHGGTSQRNISVSFTPYQVVNPDDNIRTDTSPRPSNNE